MRKQRKSSEPGALLIMLALSMSVLFASVGPTLRAQTSSAANSQPSATPVSQDDALRAACAEAIEELRAARKLLSAQGVQIQKQDELLALEKQITSGVKDLRTLDAEEKQALRDAVAAANRQVTALEAANAVLKKQRMTFWKKAKYFLIGGAAGAIVGGVLLNR